MSKFFHWMYPSGGGDEFIDSAALGIFILWTTWFESCIKIMHACIIVLTYMYKISTLIQVLCMCVTCTGLDSMQVQQKEFMVY